LKELRASILVALSNSLCIRPAQERYLILGGDKTGNANWYVDAIRRADAIYAQHLKEIGE